MPRTRKTKAQKLREMKFNTVEFHELSVLDKSYLERLDADKRLSLKIDPENLYNFDEEHMQFIYYYMQHRNVPLAAKLAGINENKGIQLFREHAVREELDRLTIALYARTFSTKMLGLEEIGGYLSAIVTDQVPDVDKLSTKDKIPVLKMLVDLNVLRKDGYENPQVIEAVQFEEEINKMSVKAIKHMIDASYDTSEVEKEDLIKSLNVDGSLSESDIEFLRTMSKEDLLKLVNELSDPEKEKEKKEDDK